MIVKMKKVFVFTEHSKRNNALESLKEMGVLHVQDVVGSGVSLDSLKDKKSSIDNALKLLSSMNKKSSKIKPTKSNLDDMLKLSYKINDIENEIKKLEIEKNNIKNIVSDYEKWGDFSVEDIKFLEDSGFEITLCIATKKQIKDLDEDFEYFIVGRSKKNILLAAVNVPEYVLIDELKHIDVPEFSLSDYNKRIIEINSKIREFNKQLLEEFKFIGELKYSLMMLEDEIEFENISSGMNLSDNISYISGFVPVPDFENFRNKCKEKGLGLAYDNPSEEDNVPTKIKTNSFISIIEPVFKFLGIVPGYREYDISFFFLLFFSIFTAIIIGDAGYGALFLIISFVMTVVGFIKSKGLSKVGLLFMLLSVCTIVWGAITGTWFGSQKIAEIPFFHQFVIDSMYSYNVNEKISFMTIQAIGFWIGVVHMTIAHFWKFIREFKNKEYLRSFSQIAWISLLWGLFNLVMDMIVYDENVMFNFSYYLIYGGMAGIMIFSSQEKGLNFFKGILKSFVNVISIFLDWISMFADIISYIRLFAVGLASLKIAMAFNEMAFGGDGKHSIISLIVGSLIVLLGHSLNIVMGMLSVIVHGVRLKILEFSNHLGLEWKGFEYKPFSKNKNLE